MTTGQRIKAARKNRGFTQAKLAEKLGIPYQSIGQWERDIRNPKFRTLMRIADALDVPVEDLTDITFDKMKFDPEGAKRAWRYAGVQDLILEILKVHYGAAERKELCHHGIQQEYFLIGIPPEQAFLHDSDMDILVRAIPSLFDRIKDTRPTEEIIAEKRGELERQSNDLLELLKKD